MECGQLENGVNTVPVPAGAELVFGQEYTYSCLSGYEPETPEMNMVINCTADGLFSLTSLPNCTGKLTQLTVVIEICICINLWA